MKKTLLFSACAALTASLVSCGGPGGKAAKTAETADAQTAKKAVPEYTVIDNAQVDLASFPQDKDGYYVIFDGKTFNGWRGYGKDAVPSRWLRNVIKIESCYLEHLTGTLTVTGGD